MAINNTGKLTEISNPDTLSEVSTYNQQVAETVRSYPSRWTKQPQTLISDLFSIVRIGFKQEIISFYRLKF